MNEQRSGAFSTSFRQDAVGSRNRLPDVYKTYDCYNNLNCDTLLYVCGIVGLTRISVVAWS